MDPAFRPYVEAWRERWRREDEAARARCSRARALLPALARILREEYGAQRVALFGSLVDGRRFGLDSDIDLCVTGCRDPDPEAMAARIEALTGDIRIDVVPYEWASPGLRQWLQLESEVLGDEPA